MRRRLARFGTVDVGDRILAVAVLAATAPIVVAAARAVHRGWLPVGDDAFAAIRGHDVFSADVPLLGTWSSASLWAHRMINHPGPLQFDLAAVPVRLFGPGAGLASATAALNVASIVAVAWFGRRLVGARAATLIMVFTAGLVWAMGSELLYDPWSQYAPVLPFLAFLFCAWSVASGRGSAWPALLFAGSFVLQTHLSYVLLVPGLIAWAGIGWVIALRRSQRDRPDAWGDDRRRQVRGAMVGVATLALCWAQPLYQQLTGSPANLSAMLGSARGDMPHGPGPKGALQALGNIFAIPPFWLPPTWSSPPFDQYGTGRPVALLITALVLVALFGVALTVVARRAGDHVASTGLVTAALALALGFVSVAKATSPYGLVATYVRWLWPISMFAWSVLVVAAVRAVRGSPRWASYRRRATAISGALVGVAVVLGLLALPTADHGSAAPPWAMPVTREVSRQAIPRIRPLGPVLVRLQTSLAGFVVGPALLAEMQRHGIDFVVDDEILVQQLGSRRRLHRGTIRSVVTVVGGTTAHHPPGGSRRVAYVPGLDPAEHRLMDRLDARVRARMAALRRVPLDASVVARSPIIPRRFAESAARRAASGDQSALADLVRQGVIDEGAFGGIDIRLWADLSWRWNNESTAVLVSTLERGAAASTGR